MSDLNLEDFSEDFYKICNEIFVYGSQEEKNELLEDFVYSIPNFYKDVDKTALELELEHERSYFAENLLVEIKQIVDNSNSKIAKEIKIAFEDSQYET